MPVCATASAIAAVVSFAASYLMLQPLAEHVGVERLEPRQPLQAPLEDRHFLVAVHALDLEDRLGVELADGAGRHSAAAPPSTWRRPCWSSSRMC